MKYNDSGMLGEMKGVVIDIINELSRKLNFTYTMHIIPVTYSRANESDLQMYNVSYPGCPHLVEKGSFCSDYYVVTLQGTEDTPLPTLNIPTEILNVVGQNKV